MCFACLRFSVFPFWDFLGFEFWISWHFICFWLIFADFGWFSSIFIDFHWFSLIFVDFRWFSLIFIHFHWFSLIFIDFHWFSLIFIDFPRSREIQLISQIWPDGPVHRLLPMKTIKFGGFRSFCLSLPRWGGFQTSKNIDFWSDFMGSTKINENQWKSMKIYENQWKATKTYEKQPKVNKSPQNKNLEAQKISKSKNSKMQTRKTLKLKIQKLKT